METNDNLQIVGAEVYEVLKNVPEEKYYKIPKKITSVFEKYRDCNIDTKIDFNKTFEEQKISKQAKEIIFYISLNYWLTDEERKKTIEKMHINEIEFNKKYDVDKMFQQKRKHNEGIQQKINNENKELVKYKERWYIKIFKKIKKIFSK